MALLQALGTAFSFDKADDRSDALVDAQDRIFKLYGGNIGLADERYNPLIDQGEQANALLGNALGVNGLEAQQGFFNNFQNDPGFQAALDRGVQAMERSAAARGTLNSGGLAKDVARYVSDTTRNQAFGQRLNRLSQLGGRGQNALNSLMNVRQAGIGGQARALGGMGQARADKFTNQSNILNQGINQLYDFAGMSF